MDVTEGFVDQFAIGFGGDFAFAGGFAAAYLMKQTRLFALQTPLFLHQRHQFVDRVENRPRPVGKGAEIFDLLALDHFAGQLQAGVGEAQVDIEVGVGFVIAQQNVVFGFELLDQGVFQQQCVAFGGGENRLQADGLRDHLVDARSQIGRGGQFGGEAKVAFDPFFEAFGFAHIQQPPLFVEILVDPRSVGKVFERGE